MLPDMGTNSTADGTNHIENEETEIQYLQKGVRHLCERGLTRVPSKYILPIQGRPNLGDTGNASKHNLKLPVIDFTQLQGSKRSLVIQSLANACEEFGFFQVDVQSYACSFLL